MRIRAKVILLCAIISVSVTALLGAFLAVSLRADRLALIEKGASRQLADIAFSLASFFEEVESDLTALVANELVRTRDDRSFTNFLEADEESFTYHYGETEKRIIEIFNAYRLSHHYVNSVYMGRENGSFVRSHPRERPTQYDPRDRPWYIVARDNPHEVNETDAYPSLTTNDVNVGVEKALLDPAGLFYGVVGIDVTLVNLSDYLRNFSTNPPGNIVVIDGKGIVLASHDEGMRGKSIESISPPLSRLLTSSAAGFSDVLLDSRPQVAFFRPPTSLGFRIVALIPSREINSQIRPAVVSTVASLAAGWLLLVAFLFVGLHALVLRPLGRFTAETEHVARTSSLEGRIQVRTSDEIGVLAQSYNRMLDSLQQSQRSLEKKEADLREYRDHLEELVARRTAELKDANTRLKKEIAERIMVQQSLLEREAQYRDLVESANSIIIRFQPDGRITFFNRFAQDFFGFGENEINGQSIMGTIMVPEDAQGHDLAAVMEGIVAHPEAHVRNVNENIRRTGERVWIDWSNKAILGPDGQVAEILSIGVDITERIRTEAELRRALEALEKAKERSEAADRLKSAFLATMSHELRTPLNSIIGFTGILLQGMVGPLNQEQEKQLGMVRGSARHLLSLISDVLDISKIEAGQMTVVSEPVDLKASITKVVQTVQPLAAKKRMELLVEIGEGIGTIAGDTRRIEQVLLNLLSNAVKFTEEGRIVVACSSTTEGVEFHVTDTGIGISDEGMGRIFMPFQQVDTGLARRYEGTGLGLSICKKLVELMGGRMWAVSARGKGSTFSFSLPTKRRRSP